MNKITCLADAINHVPRVRVIKTTTSFIDNWYEAAIDSIDYECKNVTIRNESWLRSTFNFANIQFLTPVQYKGRYIGLWDKVNGKEVFDYIWWDSGWYVRYARSYDDTYTFRGGDIVSLEPLHKLTPKIELSTEELVEELKRRWVVTEGKIINS